MARKNKNWERNGQNRVIHNPPEELFIEYEDYIIYSRGLFEPPRIDVWKGGIIWADTLDKIHAWLKGISENNFEEQFSLSPSDFSEWQNIILPLVNVFELTAEKRTKLFSIYRETKIAKLEEAIKAIDKAISEAINEVWNEKIRLPIPLEYLKKTRDELKIIRTPYLKALIDLQDKRSGEHQLLYPLLKPVIDKLYDAGISYYQLEGKGKKTSPLYSLFEIFGYGNFEDATSLRSILNYVKKQ